MSRHSGPDRMAIVRHLVELHGGTVSVESEGENKGTTFRLQLSIHVGAAPEVADSPYRTPGEHAIEVDLEQLDGVRILIVEDDTDSRNVLAVLLQRLGALVEAVASASEAFERVSHRRPDVLVSDIGMPDEDGYSLIKRVRQLGGERPRHETPKEEDGCQGTAARSHWSETIALRGASADGTLVSCGAFFCRCLLFSGRAGNWSGRAPLAGQLRTRCHRCAAARLRGHRLFRA